VSLDDIKTTGVRGRPDVSGLASLDRHKLAALLWHYHDDDVVGPNAAVKLTLNGMPFTSGKAKLIRYAIDADHSNAFTAWQKMGSPAQPTTNQYDQLENAGRLAQVGSAEVVSVNDGAARLNVILARQAVVLLVLSWE
jgi:xylan 1,4-beta-xylosidase